MGLSYSEEKKYESSPRVQCLASFMHTGEYEKVLKVQQKFSVAELKKMPAVPGNILKAQT